MLASAATISVARVHIQIDLQSLSSHLAPCIQACHCLQPGVLMHPSAAVAGLCAQPLTPCPQLQSYAEETLNTLHFASVALQVRSAPVRILDPQDQLVVNLRGTITRLKTENQQLSLMLHEATSSAGTVNTSPVRMSSFGSEVGTLPWSPCAARHPVQNCLHHVLVGAPSVPGRGTAVTQHSPC